MALVTGEELLEHLGGTGDLARADRIAAAVSGALEELLDSEGTGDPTPAPVAEAALLAAADVWRASESPGGQYQLDAYQYAPQQITSVLLLRYRTLWGPWADVASFVG